MIKWSLFEKTHDRYVEIVTDVANVAMVVSVAQKLWTDCRRYDGMKAQPVAWWILQKAWDHNLTWGTTERCAKRIAKIQNSAAFSLWRQADDILDGAIKHCLLSTHTFGDELVWLCFSSGWKPAKTYTNSISLQAVALSVLQRLLEKTVAMSQRTQRPGFLHS